MTRLESLRTSPLSALAISPGIAIGPVRLYREEQLESVDETMRKIDPEQVEAEQQRLQMALQEAIAELQALVERLTTSVGHTHAAIFEAQQLMLQDPEFLEELQVLISEQHFSATSALHQAAEQQARDLEALDNEVLAARAADMRDVAARVTIILNGAASRNVSDTAISTRQPVILVAYDLTPSDTANLDPATIAGICTVVGGPTTHAAILARALEIPAIAGIDAHLLHILEDGEQVALDGTHGLFYQMLDGTQQRTFQEVMQEQQSERLVQRVQLTEYWQRRTGSTADGVAVKVFANCGSAKSAREAGEAGAEGIGLLRTEFLFGDRAVFPTEQEQYESYVALFSAFVETQPLGTTIVARTLDAGADKPFPALEPLIGVLHEANPALGLRGVRIHLAYEELLFQQLRALLRAAAQTEIDLHIMFPMIATVEEVRRLRTTFSTVQEALRAEGVAIPPQIPLGIMVETPAAAIMANVLAREVDFFSIGANDLFQYTMAADRTNSRVMSLFGSLEPAVWRTIVAIAQAGTLHRKTVALCGELAADPRIAPLLVGLGVRELSVNPEAVARVKASIHRHTLAHWQQLAQQVSEAETAAEIEAIMETVL